MRVMVPLLLAIFFFACRNDPAAGNQVQPSVKATLSVDSTQWSAADRQLNPLVNAYFDLKNALVEWDTTDADAAGLRLKSVGDRLAQDSTIAPEILQQISSISAEADGLGAETDITEKRRSFHMISQLLMPLLQQVSFKAQPVYQQVCPMAFQDDESAFWLSNQREIVNPYLGTKHPKYASGMLHCGELADSLFAGQNHR